MMESRDTEPFASPSTLIIVGRSKAFNVCALDAVVCALPLTDGGSARIPLTPMLASGARPGLTWASEASEADLGKPVGKVECARARACGTLCCASG